MKAGVFAALKAHQATHNLVDQYFQGKLQQVLFDNTDCYWSKERLLASNFLRWGDWEDPAVFSCYVSSSTTMHGFLLLEGYQMDSGLNRHSFKQMLFDLDKEVEYISG